MKKTVKILFVAIALLLIFGVTISSAAVDVNPANLKGDKNADVAGIQSVGNTVITIVTTVGSVVSVIVLVVLGIKYMMGSAEEKAEYKKTMLPYIIGATIVFAASTLAGVIYNFADKI